jgi:hypothetical protein
MYIYVIFFLRSKEIWKIVWNLWKKVLDQQRSTGEIKIHADQFPMNRNW